MTEYFILSKTFSTENPAYAFVDDEKSGNKVVCSAQNPGSKGIWKVIEENGMYQLQLGDDTEQRQAASDSDATPNVVVEEYGQPWTISPPLSEGGVDTPRTIAVAITDRLHVREWTIDGNPNESSSSVRVNGRIFNTDPDPQSYWCLVPVQN